MSDLAVPVIKLGGRDFPIPKMGARQLRTVLPACLRLLKAFGPMMQVMVGLRENPTGEKPDAFKLLESLDMTEAQFDTLFQQILFPACQRGTKDLKLDDFLELPISLIEAFDGLMVVFAQSGMVGDKKPDGEGGAQGEAESPPPSMS